MIDFLFSKAGEMVIMDKVLSCLTSIWTLASHRSLKSTRNDSLSAEQRIRTEFSWIFPKIQKQVEQYLIEIFCLINNGFSFTYFQHYQFISPSLKNFTILPSKPVIHNLIGLVGYPIMLPLASCCYFYVLRPTSFLYLSFPL